MGSTLLVYGETAPFVGGFSLTSFDLGRIFAQTIDNLPPKVLYCKRQMTIRSEKERKNGTEVRTPGT